MSTTHLPATSEPQQSPIATLLDSKAATFQLSLSAKTIDWPAFKGAMIGAALRDPKLMEVVRTDPISVLSCASVCAQLGLVPGSALGEFYLIPRNNRVKRGGEWTTVLQCTFIIGYRGLAKLAMQHPRVELIQPVLVYRSEEFDYRPADAQPVLHHAPFGVERTEDTVIGGYCLAWLRDARRPVCVVLDRSDFEDAKSRNAKEGKTNAWDTDFEAMALKTLIRRICKLLPASTDLAQALEAEEDNPMAAEARTATVSVDLVAPTTGVAALENDPRIAAPPEITTGEKGSDPTEQGAASQTAIADALRTEMIAAGIKTKGQVVALCKQVLAKDEPADDGDRQKLLDALLEGRTEA